MHIAYYDKVMNPYNNTIMAGDLNSNTLIGDAVPRIQTVINYRNIISMHISTYACIISVPSTPTYFPSDMNRLPGILVILVTK